MSNWYDRIMIVGGGGFIGGALYKHLCKLYPASTIQRVDPSVRRSSFEHDEDSYWFANFSEDAIHEFQPTIVFNCACLNQVQSENCPVTSHQDNVLVPARIVDALLVQGGEPILFVHTSSASIYDGNCNVNPTTQYAKQKHAADQIVKTYPNYRIIRLSNVFGPGMKFDSPDIGFVGKALLSKVYGVPLLLTDPLASRTYTWIGDVLNAYKDIAQSKPHSELNVFDGWTLTPLAIAQLLGITNIKLGPKRPIDGVSRNSSLINTYFKRDCCVSFETRCNESLPWIIK